MPIYQITPENADVYQTLIDRIECSELGFERNYFFQSGAKQALYTRMNENRADVWVVLSERPGLCKQESGAGSIEKSIEKIIDVMIQGETPALVQEFEKKLLAQVKNCERVNFKNPGDPA